MEDASQSRHTMKPPESTDVANQLCDTNQKRASHCNWIPNMAIMPIRESAEHMQQACPHKHHSRPRSDIKLFGWKRGE